MFYKGESVRLLRDLPEQALAQHAEGKVTEIVRREDGFPVAARVQFAAPSGGASLTVPFDFLELSLTATEPCTGVFWDFPDGGGGMLRSAMHAMLDQGFEVRQGPNIMALYYERERRVWHQGERISVPTGAQFLAERYTWDGCIVAFSGRQRFQLEFRFGDRKPPYLLLHQRYETYFEQLKSTPAAMTLLRVLLNIQAKTGARYCALPVASNWLLDENWESLLQPPYFPDLLILPQSRLPAELPPLFRTQKLAGESAVLTALPVKFAPGDDIREPTERELKLHQLRACEALGEKAYDQMYDAASASGYYSDAKEAFYQAIRIAGELRLAEESDRLSKRLDHIKAVFRSQFT